MRRTSHWFIGLVAAAAAITTGTTCGNGGIAAPMGGSAGSGPGPRAPNPASGNGSQATPAGGGSAVDGGKAVTPSPDTQERVQRAAGAGATVIPWREASLPKIELFWLQTKTASGKADGRGIAVVDGKLPWLEGDKAMAAVVAAGVKDAPTLARAAIQLLLDRGTLLAKPDDSPAPLAAAQKAVITPPALTADALEFWYFAGRAGILKVHVVLATWKFQQTPLDAVVQAGQDPIDLAKKWLADAGLTTNQWGIDKLVAACADPRAPAVLFDALATNPRAPTRARAAAALTRCTPAGAVAALAASLAKDTDAGVRKAAIEALGTLADPAARPALDKAAKDDADPDVRSYAQWALGKLKH